MKQLLFNIHIVIKNYLINFLSFLSFLNFLNFRLYFNSQKFLIGYSLDLLRRKKEILHFVIHYSEVIIIVMNFYLLLKEIN